MNNTGMNNIIIFIKRLLQREIPKPLGRWRIENCNTKMNSKIDLSNEDHCGPCGQYAINKIESKKPSNIENPITLPINNHKKITVKLTSSFPK